MKYLKYLNLFNGRKSSNGDCTSSNENFTMAATKRDTYCALNIN